MKTILFITGPSGSGKTYFKENILPTGLFYPLRSMTTRHMREGEVNGVHYDFVTETDFENANLVTYLDVNRHIRKEGDLKWLYGVPVSEFKTHADQNLLYDVIEPKYIRQMIDWVNNRGYEFEFKVLYFVPAKQFDLNSRANMKDDCILRSTNTCDFKNFENAKVDVDWCIISSKESMIYDKSMIDFINKLASKNQSSPIKPDGRIVEVLSLKYKILNRLPLS